MLYKRKLTAIEAKRHFVYVDQQHRNMFPSHGGKIDLILKNEKVEVTMDSKGRIWAALFWDRLPTFKAGSTIIMTKNRDGSYVVEAED